MSNPQAIFFDTGPLVALFSNSGLEKSRAERIYEHIEQYPHASRHVTSMNLVELFYKMKKNKIRPEAAKKNLESLGVTVFPATQRQNKEILENYWGIPYLIDFDYADFFTCRLALEFSKSHILTVDDGDMGYALAKAYETSSKSGHESQLISINN